MSGALIGGARERRGQTNNVSGWRAGLIGHSELRALPLISRYQHVPRAKEQAAARYAVTPDLAGGHPSVNGANFHPTQLRDFALRQKLFAQRAVVTHSPSPPFYLC